MPSIAEIVNLVAERGCPVLFLDTCVLLDILRSAHRENIPDATVECACRLRDAIQSSPPLVTLVMASLIPEEWTGNINSVKSELESHLSRIKKELTRLRVVDAVMQLSLDIGSLTETQKLCDELLNLSEGLLSKAFILDTEDSLRLKAGDRVIQGKAPARKGGQLKDCLILEECLELCRRLAIAGFGSRRVFCSSNINDYLDHTRQLHANLLSEFQHAQLQFTSDLPWALHELGL